jgi:hypothetical protein
MNIRKDEARILAAALRESKYNLINDLNTQEEVKRVFSRLELLEHRLEIFGIDERRQGRKSQNDFSDLLKRYSKDS